MNKVDEKYYKRLTISKNPIKEIHEIMNRICANPIGMTMDEAYGAIKYLIDINKELKIKYKEEVSLRETSEADSDGLEI